MLGAPFKPEWDKQSSTDPFGVLAENKSALNAYWDQSR
jgi:hypothetical protein